MLVFSLFTFNFSGAYASSTNLTSSEIKSLVKILKILKVSSSDIEDIKKILTTEDEPVNVVPPLISGCANNNTYNQTTGKLCPGKKVFKQSPTSTPKPVPGVANP